MNEVLFIGGIEDGVVRKVTEVLPYYQAQEGGRIVYYHTESIQCGYSMWFLAIHESMSLEGAMEQLIWRYQNGRVD